MIATHITAYARLHNERPFCRRKNRCMLLTHSMYCRPLPLTDESGSISYSMIFETCLLSGNIARIYAPPLTATCSSIYGSRHIIAGKRAALKTTIGVDEILMLICASNFMRRQRSLQVARARARAYRRSQSWFTF